MHIQITVTWQWVFITIATAILIWVVYRLIKKFMRPCSCGRWFRVKRVKILELDPRAPRSSLFGDLYYAYILGDCPCGLVHNLKTYTRRFTEIELKWRHFAHSKEFNRPDRHILLEKAGIIQRGHLPAEKIGHKPGIPSVVVDDLHNSKKVPPLSSARSVFHSRDVKQMTKEVV